MLGDTEYQLINFSNTYNLIQLSFGGALTAPHANTVRATYTVPANRVALLMYAQCSLLRDGATATPARASAVCVYTPNGKVAQNIVAVRMLTGNLGDKADVVFPGRLIMRTGDTLTINDADLSVGGTIQINEDVGLVEFAPNGVP